MPQAKRLLQFDDFKPDTFLESAHSEMKFGVSSTQCGMLCSSSYHCRSFNICNRRICELNQDDVFSIGVKKQHLLVKKKGCNYHGMRKDFAPICDPNSADPCSDLCGTGGKPVDRVWLWDDSVKTNVTNEEVVKYKGDEVLVDFAHGGNPGTRTIEVLGRLKIFKSLTKWTDAKSVCSLQGGKLFSDLDGTSEQLELLVKAQDGMSFWLGLQLTAAKQGYSDVTGFVIPDEKIVWADSQPNKGDYEDYLFVIFDEKKVADGFAMHEMPFFCEMPL